MRTGKIALLLLLAAAIAAVVYSIHFMRRGFSAKDQPSLLETLVARNMRDLAIPASAKAEKNPFPATPENLTEGREHFADHCATCHANDGSGQTEMGPNLYPKAPDMRLPQTQSLTDGEIFYIIQNGVRLTGMPAWGESHQADDTWKLVLFIRHLPTLTREEQKGMERFNPQSQADSKEEHKEEKFQDGGEPSAESEHHHHH